MVLKKIDNRIRVVIENGVQQKHRSLFFVVGDKSKDQVVILHHMLSKAQVRARPSVLWCYKKELGFSSHRKKRMKQLQKKVKSGSLDVKKDDPFELFIAATTIRYCYYGETHKILGSTYGMVILQDFEALTPNLLARTIETVEGGGIVCVLLQSMTSLKKLYTMSMDVHTRYRTEAHQEVVARFNERFILSLSSCQTCLVIDDQLRVLPISSQSLNVTALTPKTKEELLTKEEIELKELKDSLQDTQPVGSIINQCKTLDQAKAVLKFIEVISEKTLRSTVALTAARGRGKSAAIGLALASAVAFGYSNIFVTSPSPENLQTLFEFVFKGFDALDYQEHVDYEIIQSTNPDFNKAVVRVNIFREHRQTIQYVSPTDHHKLGQAELLAIDEAAAIPLPYVKELLGPYLVFMSSTINGYEGTGRSLSLKLIEQLRSQSVPSANKENSTESINKTSSRILVELSLNESIRYANGDPVEKWLNNLLCLDASVVPRISSGCPLPEKCDLYYINRDTLFSYHKASEMFLQRIMSLYVASHYKNTPNDLQLMSDAPAHHLFCLLGPVEPTQTTLPEVLCVVQVCLEGEISKDTILNSLSRGKRASGDMIPWTISQQYNDSEFGSLSGGRIVRIATHPDFQKMGYGKRALQQLIDYYSGNIPNLHEDSVHNGKIDEITDNDIKENLMEEVIKPRKNLPPLLLKLSERAAENLDYLGVSYGLTSNLLKFWKHAEFIPVYLRQSANELTGEHSCIMLRILNSDVTDGWLKEYWLDFRKRFISLLSYQFKKFSSSLGLSMLQTKLKNLDSVLSLTKEELNFLFTNYDLKRLDLYSKNMVDYHLIMDLLPEVARQYFLKKLDISLSAVQTAILLGIGLQRKSVDDLQKELDLPSSQILGLFNKILRKSTQFLNGLVEAEIEKSILPERSVVHMEPTRQSLKQELAEVEKDFQGKKKKEMEKLKNIDLSQYEITGSNEEWSTTLGKTKSLSNVSIQSTEEKRSKRKSTIVTDETEKLKKKKKKIKKKHSL
ncbi:RNA cytidine acetyltransferase-like [Hydractinia symbiolongicarpus]|uniref:RNA cytidine acetyltransferase-like n=1 Tax=Hydractinia symbiolongicarpus TaxID=13093 RepID=UPI00254F3058|nr:RNA cytidine acetyltransferase-like [Hydractinia symbiolongicarpus]